MLNAKDLKASTVWDIIQSLRLFAFNLGVLYNYQGAQSDNYCYFYLEFTTAKSHHLLS